MKKLVLLSTMVFLVWFAGIAWGVSPKGGEVPIGTVLDWWRPDAAWTVPDGYQICDGSVVTDTRALCSTRRSRISRTNLSWGVTDVSRIGASGGNDSHSHTVDIDHAHVAGALSFSGDHAHIVDLPLYNATVNTANSRYHNHPWLDFQVISSDGSKHFITYDADGNAELTSLWYNGIGDEGVGNYPFAVMYAANRTFYTLKAGDHNHSVSLPHDHPAFSSGSSGSHTHSLTLSPLGQTYRDASSGSNTPPYYGLLKIMRIR